MILISNSSMASLDMTVNILAGPNFISSEVATLYFFKLGVVAVYIPKIPLLVFSDTSP